MLLIIQVIAAVIAWRAGWRATALLPIGIAVILGVLLGIASGGDFNNVAGLLFGVDIACIATLAYMAVHPPKSNSSKTT